MKVCPTCGHQNPDKNNVCEKCNTALSSSTPEPLETEKSGTLDTGGGSTDKAPADLSKKPAASKGESVSFMILLAGVIAALIPITKVVLDSFIYEWYADYSPGFQFNMAFAAEIVVRLAAVIPILIGLGIKNKTWKAALVVLGLIALGLAVFDIYLIYYY